VDEHISQPPSPTVFRVEVQYNHTTPLLIQLHWLKKQIEFKLAVLVYRYLHRMALPYLADEFHQSSDAEARHRLRSVSSSLLVVRRSGLSSFNHLRSSFSGRRFRIVEHSAAEGHFGAVTDCF